MFRIAICDDENFFAEKLRKLISDYLIERGLVFEIDIYSSGEALVELGIELIKYTAIFLDINMDKAEGIKTAEKIRKISREVFIIFISAYLNYSLEGYRFDALRYLLKNSTNFASTVYECMDALMNKLNYFVAKRVFDFKEGKKEVSLERLLYVESNLHKLEFHIMEDNMKIYTMYEKLNTLEDKLAVNGFIRIHQSYLVNTKYIKNVIRYKVVLTNGIELIIPKARYTYVKEQFRSYQGKL